MSISLSGLDIVLIVLLVLAIIRATFRGFVKEVLALSSVILGILLAVLFSGSLGKLLHLHLGMPDGILSQAVAFLAIFIVVYLLLKLFEAGLKNLLEKAALENLDRALGFFVGLIEGFLLVFLVLFGLQIQPFFELGSLLENSICYKLLSPLFPFAEQVFGSATAQ